LQLPTEEFDTAASLAILPWFSSSLHSLLLSSVYIHTAFGGGGPRWHPLNVAGHHAVMARRQSESGLAGGMVTEA
jgi:hypothetical protein